MASAECAIIRRMLHVGLTGNIGSGKSTVVLIFAELGAHVIDADEVVHEILGQGSEVYANVIRAFGEAYLRPDGTIDRRKLGELVFASPERLNLLNSLIHPAVRTVVLGRIVELEQSVRNGIVIVDAALMVESGFYKLFDKIVVVSCDPALQVARVMSRDGLTAEEARARLAAQMPVTEKLKVAHYTIETSGTLRQTREQTEAIYKDLLAQEYRMRSQE
jgi:dephospho-CoA kinase